jgi:hypothetical protein
LSVSARRDALTTSLRAVPERFGFSRGCLRKLLVEDIDWQVRAAPRHAQELLQKTFAGVPAQFEALALELDVRPGRLLRNAVACASGRDLGAYWGVLQLYNPAEPELSAARDTVLAALPVPRCGLASLGFGRGALTEAAVLTWLCDDEWVSFQAMVLHVHRTYGGSRRKVVQALSRAFAKCITARPAPEGIDAVVAGVIGATGHPDGLVSRRLLDRLPQPIRREILASDLAGRILQPAFVSELETDPFAHTDAPAVLARERIGEEGMQALHRGAMSPDIVTQFCGDGVLLRRCRAELVQLLHRHRWNEYNSPLSDTAVQALEAAPDEPGARALRLIDALQAKARRGRIERSVDCVRAPELRLLDDATLVAVVGSRRYQPWHELLAQELPAGRVATIVKQWFALDEHHARPSRSLLACWYQHATPLARFEQLARHAWVHQRLMQPLPTDERTVLAWVRGCMREPMTAVQATRILAPYVLSALARHRARRQVRRLVMRAAKALRACGDEFWRVHLVRRFARLFPDEFERIALAAPRAAELAELVRRATKGASLDVSSLERRGGGHEPLWLRFLRYAEAEQVPLPAKLQRWIAADADRLLRAFSVAPGVFGDLAHQSFALAELVEIGLRFPAAARYLTRHVGHRRIASTLADVQHRSHGNKWVDAAHELSIVVGLQYAGTLRGLVVELARHSSKAPGTRLDHLYRSYELPKPSGGQRLITEPPPTLKYFQRALHRRVLAAVPLHDAATGFRPGYSIRDNAARHVRQPVVVNVDIANCFASTHFDLVRRTLQQSLGASDLEAVAGQRSGLSGRALRLLAELCCYGGALATGAPSSPTLLNIVMRHADRGISVAAGNRGIVYSRYADDLTFSGADNPQSILPFVKQVLAELGYTLDAKKTHIFRKGRRQVVTGLVVNDKPNLNRRMRRRLRSAAHHRSVGRGAHWHGAPMQDDVLLGRIAHLQLVQPEEAKRLRAQVKNAQISGDKA